MPSIPERTAGLRRSGIRMVMDLAWASPEPVIRLEVGQPDALPPVHVMEAMQEAIEAGETTYTPNAGIPQLREACARKLGRVNGIKCDAGDVLVTAGSMQALALAFQAVCEPGDEVLIPDPGWPNYEMSCRIASLRPVRYSLRPELGYRPDMEVVESLVTERTRVVLVNSPSNPLGVVFGAEEMRSWVELAGRHDLWLLSDECYDQLVFDGTAVSPASLPGGSERVISVHSFSKTYAMTGLRVGYVSGPSGVVETMTKMQEAVVACVNGIAQRGAVAALEGPQDYVESALRVFRRRRDLAVRTATRVSLPYLVPEGAFYLWVPLGERIRDSVAFCRSLIERERVAVAPGSTFGPAGSGAIRVSLAAADEKIEEGLVRIARFVGN